MEKLVHDTKNPRDDDDEEDSFSAATHQTSLQLPANDF